MELTQTKLNGVSDDLVNTGKNSIDPTKISIDEAWSTNVCRKYERQRREGDGTVTEVWVIADLICDCVFGTGQMPISVPNEDYMSRYESGPEWFDHHFLISHCQLLFHRYHRKDLQLVNIMYGGQPVQASEVFMMDSQVQCIYSIFHGNGHYVLMEMDLQQKVVRIIDGLGTSLNQWGGYVKKVLQRIGKISLASLARFEGENGSDNSRMILNEESNGGWSLVGPETYIKQKDGHSCGPIAMMKLLSVFNRLPEGTLVEQLTSNEIRKITMGDFRSLLNEFRENEDKRISVTVPKRRQSNVARSTEAMSPGQTESNSCVETIDEPENVDVDIIDQNRKDALAKKSEFRQLMEGKMISMREKSMREKELIQRSAKVGDCVKMKSPGPTESNSCVESIDEAENVDVDIIDQNRKDALAKKTEFRQLMEGKMISMRDKDLIQRSAKVGDCVKMKLDKREVPHAKALLGVAYNVGKGGGAQVVTTDGIISSDGDAYYVPVDRYSVIPEDTVQSVVPESLQRLRASILSGLFEAEVTKKSSMVAAYMAEYGWTSTATGGCGCKKKCRGQCGCKKKLMACGEGCRCRGKCGNPFNTN